MATWAIGGAVAGGALGLAVDVAVPQMGGDIPVPDGATIAGGAVAGALLGVGLWNGRVRRVEVNMARRAALAETIEPVRAAAVDVGTAPVGDPNRASVAARTRGLAAIWPEPRQLQVRPTTDDQVFTAARERVEDAAVGLERGDDGKVIASTLEEAAAVLTNGAR